MCSISGFYCYANHRPHPETLKGLMLACQTRGSSAAGMAYMTAKSEIMIRKQKGPAKDLVEGMSTEAWDEVAASPRALFHARATTKGTENDNENNHPVSHAGWVVVHNGHITNDDELFEYYKADRYAAVDTAAIPLVLKQGKDYEDSLRQLSILAGNASIAVWSLAEPDKIAIARLGTNDVYFFLDPSHEILYWCSTPLAGRSIPGYRVKNLGFFTVSKLHEDKLAVLSPKMDDMRLLKIERRPFSPVRYRVLAVYASGIGASGATPTPPTVLGDRIGFVSKHENKTRGKDSRAFTWGQPNAALKGKPDIDTSQVQSNWFDWTVIRQKIADYAAQGGKHIVFTQPTAYGRWMFDCVDSSATAKLTAVFLPAKRIKKYWRRHFAEELPDLRLPTELAKLDRIMTLEEFSFIEQTNDAPPGRIYIMGYMCPWCGVTGKTHEWSRLEFRCPACGIISRPFTTRG